MVMDGLLSVTARDRKLSYQSNVSPYTYTCSALRCMSSLYLGLCFWGCGEFDRETMHLHSGLWCKRGQNLK